MICIMSVRPFSVSYSADLTLANLIGAMASQVLASNGCFLRHTSKLRGGLLRLHDCSLTTRGVVAQRIVNVRLHTSREGLFHTWHAFSGSTF